MMAIVALKWILFFTFNNGPIMILIRVYVRNFIEYMYDVLTEVIEWQ